MKRVPPLLILLIVAAVVAGGYGLLRSRTPAPDPANGPFTQTVTVTRGSIYETISVSGVLDAVRKKTLQFEKSKPGTPLQTLLVKTGDSVLQGDVLATINPVAYEQALEQAQLALQAAEEQVARLTAPPSALERDRAALELAKAELRVAVAEDALATARQPDLTELRQNVAAAEKTLAAATKTLQEIGQDPDYAGTLRQWQARELAAGAEQARLAAENYSDIYHRDRLRVAQNEYADAVDGRIMHETAQAIRQLSQQLAVRRAERALADARQALTEAEAGPAASPTRAQVIAKATLTLQEARLAVEQAREAVSRLDLGPDAAALTAAQAEVDQQRLEVKAAEQALTETRLVAPFDSVVLQTRLAAGTAVGPTVDVLTLADLTDLQLTAWVDEFHVRRLTAGQSATITFEALPFETFTGRVKAVPLQAQMIEGMRVFMTPLSLDDPTGLPRQMGISANIEIEVGRAEDVIVVPAMAVQSDGPDNVVLVPAPDGRGEPLATPVEIGLSDGINTEIRAGLQEGDTIVIPLEGAPDDAYGAGFSAGPGARAL